MADGNKQSPVTSDRRRFLKVTGSAAAVTAGAGCLGSITGGSGGGGGGGTTIEYLSDRGGSKEYFEQIASDFEDENSDITVEMEYTSKGTSMLERLSQRIAGGNPPDIVFGPSVDAYRFAVDGNAVPVTDVNDELGIDSPTVHEGEEYISPLMRQVWTYWYRNDLYDANPGTFDEWQAQAKAAESADGDTRGFLALNGETNIGSTSGFQLVWSAGAQIFGGESGNIEVVLDQGENREKVANALSWYGQMHEYSPDAIDWGWGDSYNALAQESVAAAPGLGSDPALTVQNNNDEIADKVSGSLAPRADGTEPPIFQYVQGHIIHGESESPEAAKEFVKYFHESEHYFDWLVSSPMYLLPFNKDQMDHEAFTENEFISNHMDMWNLYKDNWDRFQLLEDTSDGEEPNLVAANAYNEQVLGWMLSQAVVRDEDPATVVDETAERLRQLQE